MWHPLYTFTNNPTAPVVVVTRDGGAGSGKYRYQDDEVWLFIEQLKRDHKKPESVEVKPEPRPETVSKQVKLYDPEVESLLLDISIARAASSPKRNVMSMIKKLDKAMARVQREIELEEDDLIVEIILH